MMKVPTDHLTDSKDWSTFPQIDAPIRGTHFQQGAIFINSAHYAIFRLNFGQFMSVRRCAFQCFLWVLGLDVTQKKHI